MSLLNKTLSDLLPDTLVQAIKPIEKTPQDYLSDPAAEKVDWDEENGHAIYLGKWPRNGKGTLYNDEAVLALVDYAHAQDPDHPVLILLGPQFSECFNGEKLGEGTEWLSPEEEKRHLRNLIQRKLGLGSDKVKIQFMHEDPKNRQFLEYVYSQAQNGKPIEAIAKEMPTEIELSLRGRILKGLLLACEKYPDLKEDFWGTVPAGNMTEGVNLAEDIPSEWGPATYGLIEVVVRLADLIQWRPIQLGVSRQAVYDAIILKLLRSAKKNWKVDYPELRELFQELPGKTLRPIKLKSGSPNYFEELKDQMKARVRLALVTTGLLVTAGVGVLEKQKIEEEALDHAQSRLVARASDCSQDLNFLISEDNWARTYRVYKDPTETFLGLVDANISELREMYEVAPNLDLKPQMMDFLCQEAQERPSRVSDADLHAYQQFALIQDFVGQHRSTFELAGYSLGHPYPSLWEKREWLFDERLTEGDDPLQDPVYLGAFKAVDPLSLTYQLWTNSAQDGLWASSKGDSTPQKKTARDAVKSLKVLEAYSEVLPALDDITEEESEPLWNSREVVEAGKDLVQPCTLPRGKMIGGCDNNGPLWTNQVAGESYMFKWDFATNPVDNSFDRFLFAKRPEDREYRVSTAVEAYTKMQEVREATWTIQ